MQKPVCNVMQKPVMQHHNSSSSSSAGQALSADGARSSPASALHTAAAASAIWQDSGPLPPQRCTSPAKLGARSGKDGRRPLRSSCSPRTHGDSVGHSWKSRLQSPGSPGRQLQSPAEEDESEDGRQSQTFQHGVRHAGWLWKRFGHRHKATWRKLWVYCCDDRLCYHEPDTTGLTSTADTFGSPGSAAGTSSRATATAVASASREGSPVHQPLVGYYGSTMGSTAGSLAALAAGEVRYIALDRIPVRPLPHRQHELDPLERSHPDCGITMVDDSIVSGKPAHLPPHATFSLVSGSHTHYFAADSQHAAELWVSVIRDAWLHCFSHTARCTGGSGTLMSASAAGVAASQRLMAENALLRDSIQELNQQVTQAHGEYWKKWVEEKAKNTVLESKLVNIAVYEVVVRTANVKGAASDARVYIELYGPSSAMMTMMMPLTGSFAGHQAACLTASSSSEAAPLSVRTTAAAAAATAGGAAGGCLTAAAATDDSSGEVRLFDADSSVKPFQRGATDSFRVACYNVGLPARLKVWHDNTGHYPDWFLLDIKVRKEGVREWVTFPCNRWLSTQHDDGSISRLLSAGSSRPLMVYKLLVTTSDLRGAGTDANVWVQLHGFLGEGLQHQLLGGATAFDRGAQDEFFIEDADLGELTALTISHDASGTSPAWHLANVEVLPCGPCSQGGSSAVSSSMHRTSSPDLTAAADPYPARRASTGSPQLGMWGASAQQLRKSTSRNGGSPVASSQSRAAGASSAAYLFPCDAWLDEVLGAGTAKIRLPVASCLEAKAWYTVYITTSDIRGAATDADVHIALSGSQGSSGVVALPSQPEQYQRGQRDKFRLQLPPLGQLQKLLIGHNNKGQTPSWHLALVEVVDEGSGHTTYFAADRWLGAAQHGLSEVTLVATSTDPRQSQCDYQVCFLTSPCRGASTDSCVGFELRGSKGSSGPITVSAGREALQRGGSDTFTYRRPHLGQLQQLVVWHDNSGASITGGRGPWCLEAVVVSCKAGQQVVTFPHGGWLSAETGLRVELLPGKAKGATWYRIDVVTSDVRGAGTDAAISLELSGHAGTPAGPWVLDRQGAFGRGQVDSFTVAGVAVQGPARLAVTLGVTPDSVMQHSWHLDHIKLTVLDGGKDSTAGRTYYFVANRWFDSAAGTHSTVLTASSKPPTKEAAELQPHTVRVFTSALRGAGTDAAIAVNAIGVSGASGWKELPARPKTFEQGQEDVFTVLLPDVGALTHLGIRSDGSGQQPAWHLAKVCVQRAPASPAKEPALAQQQQQQQNSNTLAPVWFNAQRWFDAAHGLEAVLPAQPEDPASNLVIYQVQVYTSDLMNAGTDCRVFLQLSGEGCTGPPMELQAAGGQLVAAASFQRGCVDGFTLQLPVLGPLRSATVWMEGCASPWHLDLIAVTGPQGEQTFFVCRSWLGSSACSLQYSSAAPPLLKTATSLSPVELLPSSTDPRRALKEYKIVTYTSDIKSAGTDASVFVELIDGNGASSERRQLLTSAPDAFERGKADSFSITCQALSNMARLRVGHDGRGAKPSWHLSKVEVTDVAAKQTWYFAAECWLDAAQGDGAIERTLLASDKDPWADKTVYKVTLVTSKRPESGANDAAVVVTLYGSDGPPVTSTQGSSSSNTSASRQPVTTQQQQRMASSGRQELQPSSQPLGKVAWMPGSACSFMLPAMHRLGQLRQLLLEVNMGDGGSKQVAAWHCQHVEVTDTGNGDSWLFPCNAWLGSSSPVLPATLASTAAAASLKAESSKLLVPAPNLDGLFKQLQDEQQGQGQEQYKIAVYTSAHSPQQSCVEALIITITAAGGGGTLGPLRLSKAPQPCFTAGSCDVFEATSPTSLDDLLEAKVACELQAAGSWHLDTIAVTAQSTGATTWFHAGRWFDAAAGYQAVMRGSLGDVRKTLLQYKVTAYTSDCEGAACSARVYIQLSGAAGSSSTQELQHPSSIGCSSSPAVGAPTSSGSSNGFGRGQSACFFLSSVPLGELQELVIWHDSSGPQPAWHLAYVEVTELTGGKVWFFPCGAWLDNKCPHCTARRTLLATTSFSPDSLLMRYRVRVTTGDVRGASTDAAVHVDICGTLSNTGLKCLNASGQGCTPVSLDRASSHEATVSGVDVGEMTHCVVSLDGSSLLSSWYLEELEVEHLGTGQVLRFKVGRWLDDKRPGCSLQYELWPDAGLERHSSQGRLCSWELVLYTGSIPSAGTDADVYVELHGTSAAFGPHMLPASTEAFQAGCRDSFSLETPDLGELLTLAISHNSKGRSTAWFLHGVELTHLPSSKRYSWRVSAWLDPKHGCSRTLKVTQAERGPLKPPDAAASGRIRSCSYQLEVQTADVDGAGTSAAMFVQLGGALQEAEAVQLTSSAGSTGGGSASSQHEPRGLFQRGCLDVFILKGMPDVGPFTHITIGHDGSGAFPGWCLAWVRIINLTTGNRALFAGNIWLDGSRAGCQNWARLPAGPDEQQQQQQQQPVPPAGQLEPRSGCPVFGGEQQPTAGAGRRKSWLPSNKQAQPGYSVTFLTSNIWGGGTGSKVFFELVGQDGSSGVVYPTGPRSHFARGCKASFLYPRLPYVGELHQLRVGTDGSGLFAAWHLRQVEVVHVHSGQRWVFDCNEWLDRRNVWQLLLPAAKV